MGFPKWLNFLIQGIAIGGGVYTQVSPAIPPSVGNKIMFGFSLAQAIAGMFAHYYNPDGSPASVAYVPPKN